MVVFSLINYILLREDFCPNFFKNFVDVPLLHIKKINHLTASNKFSQISFQSKNYLKRIKKQFIVTVTAVLLHSYKDFSIYVTFTKNQMWYHRHPVWWSRKKLFVDPVKIAFRCRWCAQNESSVLSNQVCTIIHVWKTRRLLLT